MRKYFLSAIIIVSFLLPSCIIYSTVKYEIEYNENFTMGTVKVTYTNLRDSEADKDKQKKDFIDLVEMLEEDEFLLDNIDDGVYVRNRYLYEENDQLIGSYSGIFKSLKIDSEELKTKENERILILDKDEGDIVTTNGKVLESEDSFIISWPKDVRKLEFTVKKSLGKPTYSLLDYYHEWKNN
jgi:hypothetical protein